MQDFATALLDPDLPPPRGLNAARFAIYRNNVLSGLGRALAQGFPVVGKIVGEAFFAAMAQVYIRRNPPRSPVLLHYGQDFGDFVAGFAPAAELPYLPDVARLEAAYSRVFHAADRVPLASEALARLDAATLPQLRVILHPAIAVIRSAHPVATIWAMNTGALPLGAIDEGQPEDALVARPGLQVQVRQLTPGQAAFILALQQGIALGEAAALAFAEAPAFDFPAALALLFSQGLVTDLEHAA